MKLTSNYINEWLKYGCLNGVNKLQPERFAFPGYMNELIGFFEQNVPEGIQNRCEILKQLLRDVLNEYLKKVVDYKENKTDFYCAAAITIQYLMPMSRSSVGDLLKILQNAEPLQQLNWKEEWITHVCKKAAEVDQKNQYFRTYRLRGVELLDLAIKNWASQRSQEQRQEYLDRLQQYMQEYGLSQEDKTDIAHSENKKAIQPTSFETSYEDFDKTTQQSYLAFRVWVPGENINQLEFSLIEVHTLWECIQNENWTLDDTRNMLNQFKTLNLIMENEELGTYYMSQHVLKDVIQRWSTEVDTETQARAVQWYKQINENIDLPWLQGFIPVLLLLILVVIFETSYLKIGGGNAPFMINLVTSFLIGAGFSLWKGMTLSEVLHAGQDIVRLWLTHPQGSPNSTLLPKHLNIRQLAATLHVRDFNQKLWVLGILLIVLTISTVVYSLTTVSFTSIFVSLTALTIYVVLTALMYGIARYIQLYRWLNETA